MSNIGLLKAKMRKNDEFFTTIETIEEELLQHKEYFDQLKGKTVFCNCNDTEYTNFYLFFFRYFKQIGLKKLIATSYSSEGSTPAYKLEFDGEKQTKTYLEGNGDCFSEESIKILDSADVVVTNPPFSKFKAFVDLLISHNKDFIILGLNIGCAYTKVFPLFASGQIKIGYNLKAKPFFINNGGEIRKLGFVWWYTTLKLEKKVPPLVLVEKYEEGKYEHYDNFDAIEVPQTRLIPINYNGLIGVPPSFLSKYNPDQFRIIDSAEGSSLYRTKIYKKGKFYKKEGDEWIEKRPGGLNTSAMIALDKRPEKGSFYIIDGKMYKKTPRRILIQKKQSEHNEF